MRNIIIIPTYDEAKNISALLDILLSLDENLDILVVDDNSPDGTGNLVKTHQEKTDRVKLIERNGKLGLGSAYTTGFKYALERDYELILQMDADFSHNPAVIPDMIRESKQADLVIGSRYIKGINVVNWPLQRLILSWGAAKYVRVITGMPVCDPTGGFKCWHRKVLQSINLDAIMSDGYSFQIEMNYRTWLLNYKIKEMPIIFEDRRSGQSKMSKRIVHEAIYMVWKLKYYQLIGKIPCRR
ncbi:MAG: polyprenol monophosphomannose synthase [Candidatus Cloacimonetes bacterium]|nr:polyprenol monophosphomannose synthase [Candidatus Cloacimonadota bacterium]